MPELFEVLRGVDDTPLGELGFGVEFMALADSAGAKVRSYEWVYGGAARTPFPPHVALDGTRRERLDGWVTTASFPGFGFYFPGDHAGCVCDSVPSIEPPRDIPPPDVRLLDLLNEAVRDFLGENPERSMVGVDPIGVLTVG